MNDEIEALQSTIEIDSASSFNSPCEEKRSVDLEEIDVSPENQCAYETRSSQCRNIIRAPMSTKLKVRADKSAKVLVSIVILFLMTHCYRLILKAYESSFPNTNTIDSFKICFNLQRYVFLSYILNIKM